MKSIKTIESNEEITISYQEINTFFSLDERRLLMTDYFYFQILCECNFCTYESTWVSHQENNPNIILITYFDCSKNTLTNAETALQASQRKSVLATAIRSSCAGTANRTRTSTPNPKKLQT